MRAGPLALASLLSLLGSGCGGAGETAAGIPAIGDSPWDPIPGAAADLDARLLLIEERPQPWLRLLSYHGRSGALDVVFAAPEGAALLGLTTAPDGDSALLSYIPPPADGDYDTAGIFWLDLTTPGAQPEPLLWPERRGEILGLPLHSEEGIYFVRSRSEPSVGDAAVTVERYDITRERTDTIAEWATQPALSPDGHLAYVAIDPDSYARRIVVSNADGTQPRTLIDDSLLPGLAFPRFSPAGGTLFFAAEATQKHAEGGAVDWWRVSLSGGLPERVLVADAHVHDAVLSPEGDALLYTSETGLWQAPLYGAKGDPVPETLLFSRALRSLACVNVSP